MNEKSKAVQEILPLLKQYDYKVTKQHEDWVNLEAPDKSYKAHLSHSTLSFCHPTKKDFQYVFGVSSFKYIERFLANPPSPTTMPQKKEDPSCNQRKKTKK